MKKFNREKETGKVYNKINKMLDNLSKQLKRNSYSIRDITVFWAFGIPAIYIDVEQKDEKE